MLLKYVDKTNAEQLADQIFDWAVELDEMVNTLKNDPRVRSLYTYDGKMFKNRIGPGFCKSYDGLNFLKMLGDSNLNAVQDYGCKVARFLWLKEEYVDSTRLRLKMLETSNTIVLTADEGLEELHKEMRRQ